MDVYLERIETLKARLVGIVEKMECSENEKKLACIDITETIELLLDAEEGWWDLDDCRDESVTLEKENKALRRKLKRVRDSTEEIVDEIGDDYE